MEPDCVLRFEPPQAQTLEWLPLAVRFKLDACCLKVQLEDWRHLPRAEREALLICPAGMAFEDLVLALVPHARRLPARAAAAQSALRVALAEALSLPAANAMRLEKWLRGISPYERYLLGKVLLSLPEDARRSAFLELVPAGLRLAHEVADAAA